MGIVDEAERPGFLHVRGPSIADGYWQRQEASTTAFAGGWLRTGDVYTRSDDGRYTFLGRNNDMIKAGGIWVSPAEVEGVLIEHPSVMEAAVVGARDADGLETTVAFVVAASGHTVDQAEIEAHCRARNGGVQAAPPTPRGRHPAQDGHGENPALPAPGSARHLIGSVFARGGPSRPGGPRQAREARRSVTMGRSSPVRRSNWPA